MLIQGTSKEGQVQWATGGPILGNPNRSCWFNVLSKDWELNSDMSLGWLDIHKGDETLF